jgi:hypothetical protein
MQPRRLQESDRTCTLVPVHLIASKQPASHGGWPHTSSCISGVQRELGSPVEELPNQRTSLHPPVLCWHFRVGYGERFVRDALIAFACCVVGERLTSSESGHHTNGHCDDDVLLFFAHCSQLYACAFYCDCGHDRSHALLKCAEDTQTRDLLLVRHLHSSPYHRTTTKKFLQTLRAYADRRSAPAESQPSAFSVKRSIHLQGDHHRLVKLGPKCC